MKHDSSELFSPGRYLLEERRATPYPEQHARA
jgi:hypothetical protein